MRNGPGRRIPIRVKLAGALAVPLVAMGFVTLFEVKSVADDARDVQAETSLAAATSGPNGLIAALQDERNWATAYLVGVHEQVEMAVVGFEATRAQTDAALREFESEMAHRGDLARAAYAPAIEHLEGLVALRQEIDGHVDSLTTLSMDNMPLTTEIFMSYTGLIEPFFGGMSRISIAMDDPELRQGASQMETITRQLELTPQITNAIVLPSYSRTAPGDEVGINSPAEIARVAELHDAFRTNVETLLGATGPYAEIVEKHYPHEFADNLDRHATQALETGTIDIPAFLEGLDAANHDITYLGYRDELSKVLQERADELNRDASTRQVQFGVLMALTFIGAVALTTVVSLSITRPLRSLTRQAKEMADRRLPEAVSAILDTPLGDDVVMPSVAPVRVGTRDEVGDVADALNTVQDSALDLAVEQAVLRRNIADSFVNLGRRNQNLLGRQLDFITALESNETDPDTLASLFRLDHLATRMRRNAESLLVLAGVEPPRQWTAPVRLADVIRAAVGEVENYQRVTVRSVEPASVQGSAAADLAHLLAELIENALSFSPPDRPVEIRGMIRPDRGPGQPGAYTLAVIDSGLGMSEHDIAAANRRLAGTESFTVAPSKYLGHYVAGNLATRHGIRVQLHSAPGNGVTATVDVPLSLLTDEPGAGGPEAARSAQPEPAVTGGHRAITAGPAPAHPATAPAAGALPRRRSWSNGGAPAPQPTVSLSNDQLASFSRTADRARAAGQPFGGGGPGPTGGPSPAPSAPPAFPSLPPAQPGVGGPGGGATAGGLPRRQPAGGAPTGGPVGGGTPGGGPFGGGTPGGGRGTGSPPPLPRRDRGAQMPTTAPIRLRERRGADAGPDAPGARPPAAGPAQGPGPAGGPFGPGAATGQGPRQAPPGGPPGAAPAAGQGPGQSRANEVYDFLSTFTAGVQRGLDASRGQDGR